MKNDKNKIAVFAYNFPHKKTYDFIMRLLADNFSIDIIFAANRVELNIPPSTIRTSIRHQSLVHPRDVASNLNIPYIECAHDSPEIMKVIQESEIKIGIISGSRILKKEIISCFELGIINFHPGLLPEIRGLDALLWSIEKDIPAGVSSHIIDHKVDAGLLIEKRKIPIYNDDTIFDLSERLYETQLEMLKPAILKTINKENEPLLLSTSYNKKMSSELEKKVLEKVPDYIRKYSK